MRLRWLRRPGPRGELFVNRALRRTGYRNDTEYLMSSPANVRWLDRAIASSRAGLSREMTIGELRAELGLGPEG